MKRSFVTLYSVVLILAVHAAQAGEYHLTIIRQSVNITGHPVDKITVNGTIPAPTLHFTEGEDVTVHVTNSLDEPTSIHWHGFLIPAAMDGVPGFNGFPGIMPHQTFTYHFKVRQSGTYWYHSHSQFQEQDGLYGGIVIAPKGTDPIETDRDYVVVLSDFTNEQGGHILNNLKMSSDYYNYARRTLGDFFGDVHQEGFAKAWENAKEWGQMRMSPTDLSDVSGYTFLVNGRTPQQNWTGLFKPGERVRLRFINASAMSFYDVSIPGLKMTVVAADGQNVEPVKVDEFRIGVAETYDVVVTPKDGEAYTIGAESIDRTGFALGTLAPREGMKGPMPASRPRALLTMGDMGMMDMDGMTMTTEDMKSGWAQAGTPPGDRALSYADLRYAGIQKDTRQPDRTLDVRLGGNMERYIWTINGKKFQNAEPIQLNYGERVRLRFTNETMMAHPMHLHGMFVQLENGQPAAKLANKHTVIIPPGQSYSVLLTADEPGEWAFHCHLLYHMAAGMMRKVVVAKLDPSAMPPPKDIMKMDIEGGHHIAH
jgi:FtsP/CotA-like multicopper oxidase with cupredoxin domain